MRKTAQNIWNIKRIFAFLLISATGAGLHFIWQNIYMYPWAQIAAPLVPVNESYWEHTKLAVIPLGMYFIIQYFHGFKNKQPKGVWAVSAAAGLWSALLSVFIIHATLIAAFGHDLELAISIVTFFINVWIGMSVFHSIQRRQGLDRYNVLACTALILLYASLIVYSYWPLPIHLFESTDFNYFGQYPPG